MLVAPASRLFSMSSFRAEAGLCMICPRAYVSCTNTRQSKGNAHLPRSNAVYDRLLQSTDRPGARRRRRQCAYCSGRHEVRGQAGSRSSSPVTSCKEVLPCNQAQRSDQCSKSCSAIVFRPQRSVVKSWARWTMADNGKDLWHEHGQSRIKDASTRVQRDPLRVHNGRHVVVPHPYVSTV